jgi:hypothetical protein
MVAFPLLGAHDTRLTKRLNGEPKGFAERIDSVVAPRFVYPTASIALPALLGFRLIDYHP